MPTTRAARAAATAAAARKASQLIIELPTDALGLVLYQLPLAHDIAAVAPTCHQFCDAAKLAQKLRPFSGEVVRSLNGPVAAWCGTEAGRHRDTTIKVWMTVRTHHPATDRSRCCPTEHSFAAQGTPCDVLDIYGSLHATSDGDAVPRLAVFQWRTSWWDTTAVKLFEMMARSFAPSGPPGTWCLSRRYTASAFSAVQMTYDQAVGLRSETVTRGMQAVIYALAVTPDGSAS